MTEALCRRWSPGARLLPASDDRSETHVVITDPEDGEKRAIHFQEWWVRHRARVPTDSFASSAPDRDRRPRRHRRDRRRRRRVDRAVQPGGEHRRDPGDPRCACRIALDAGAGDRLLPHHRGKAVARHGRRMPVRDRRAESARRRWRALRRPVVDRHPGLLAGPRGRSRRHRRPRGARGAPADDRSRSDRRDGARRNGSGRGHGRERPWHGRRPSNCCPCPGCRSSDPGDDLAAAIAEAAPWLRDDDVLVVTSKVLSKCEGRIVAAPSDPDERDALRRKLIDGEAVRVLARKGRTLITENALGSGAGGRRSRRLQRRLRRTRAAARRSRRAALRRCARRCANGWASPSASSSPTRWAGPGATARPTSRSARPG